MKKYIDTIRWNDLEPNFWLNITQLLFWNLLLNIYRLQVLNHI